MKLNTLIKIGAAALVAMTVLTGCSTGASTKDFDYKTDISEVHKVLDTKDKKFLKLVNKQNSVEQDFEPDDLVNLDTAYTTGGKSIPLEEHTATAVMAMIDEMKACGITNVTVTSGYRTYKYQQQLFDRYLNDEREAHPAWSEAQIEEYVLTYSARPGTSEHQTGLCVDLITDEMVGLWNFGSETPDNPYDKGFAETDAYEWLCENAHKFGFILRFPEDKTDVTGYSYESWHYRFVGVAAATEIYEKGITLEEYLGK